MAAIHPLPPGMQMPLPTGQELMSTPIVSGGVTRRDKEINWVIQNIRTRISSLNNDEKYQVWKLRLFGFGVFSAMVGMILILYGLHMTVLFEKYFTINIPALVFGGLFCLPLLYWFYRVFFPSKEEKMQRRKIHKDRRDRRKPTLFNEIVKEAKKACEPPPRKIRVLAHFRKHDYPIIASTWKEFCDNFENQTGLPIERQFIRFKDEDLEIDFLKKLDEHYGLDNGDRLHIYNRGGFFTQHNSPIKKRYLDATSALNALMEEDKRPGSEQGSRPSSSGSNRDSFSDKKDRKSKKESSSKKDSWGGPSSFKKSSFNENKRPSSVNDGGKKVSLNEGRQKVSWKD